MGIIEFMVSSFVLPVLDGFGGKFVGDPMDKN